MNLKELLVINLETIIQHNTLIQLKNTLQLYTIITIQSALSVGINSLLSSLQRTQPMHMVHLSWSTLRRPRGSLLWREQGEALSSTCLAL